MSWPGSILTDSGGYQVFSLAELRKVTDDGVHFRSHLDGSEHFLTPEKATEVQMALGSDILMVLDECIEYPASHDRARHAAARTLDWARRSRKYFAEHGDAAQQMLFGIVQGGGYADLRRQCAEQLVELDFPGYSIGGGPGGEPPPPECGVDPPRSPPAAAGRPPPRRGVGEAPAGVGFRPAALPHV